MGQPGVDDGWSRSRSMVPHDLRLFFRVVIPGFRRGQRMSIIVPTPKNDDVLLGAQPSPSRTSLLRLNALHFVDRTLREIRLGVRSRTRTTTGRALAALCTSIATMAIQKRMCGSRACKGTAPRCRSRLPDAVPR